MTLEMLKFALSQMTWLDLVFFSIALLPVLNSFLLLGLYFKKRPLQIKGGGGIYANKFVAASRKLEK